jgi:tetratricopeptide (TPR) repeat protein
VCIAFVVSAAAARQPQADPRTAPRSSSWRQIVTPDLVVAGTAPPGELKRLLRELTRFRQILGKLFPDPNGKSPVPLWVIVLRDQQAFNRFQPRDSRGKPQGNVGGYFMRQPDANFIVLGASSGEYALQAIFHEYTHYVVSRNVRTPVPMWLSEGLAEFYSTFRGDYRGRTLLGLMPPERGRVLRTSTFVPLRDIVSPRNLESMWRWETQIGVLYAESWALVHYITVERKNPVSSPLSTYLASFARTGNHDSAFQDAFGTDVAGMDKELREYVRRVSLPALTFDVQADLQAADDAQPMLEADANALEGRLLMQLEADDEAERELTAVLKRWPEHSVAQVSLARLRLNQDREDEAIAVLQQVIAAQPMDGAAHYYLGSALERAWRHEEAAAAFEKAIQLMPGNPAPWSGLNSAALGLRRDLQARAALQNAMQLEWSPSRYWTQALHAFRLGRDDVAASSAATYMELRGNGEDVSIYPLFVRALAAWRADRPNDAEAALALAEKGDTREPWTLSVLRYLQGRLEESQFLREAHSLGEQTEARTYVGFKLTLAGRQDEALTHFRWVAERGAKNYLEYELVKSELNRLKYGAKR